MSYPKEKEVGAMTEQELVAAIAAGAGTENPEPSNSVVPGAEGKETPEGKPEPTKDGQPVTPDPNPAPASAAAAPNPQQSEIDLLNGQMQKLFGELESLRGDNTNLKKLNGHLSNQLGVLRNPPPKLPTDADVLEKPVDSVNTLVDAALTKKEQVRKAEEELANRQTVEVLSLVNGNVPDFKEHIEGMAKILEEHRAPAEFVAFFRQNPAVAIPDAAHLVQLASRAKERKTLADKDAEIAKLKQQIETANKGTADLAKNLKTAAAAGPSITGTNVKTKPGKGGPPDFSKMKTADIRAWIEEHKDDSGDE